MLREKIPPYLAEIPYGFKNQWRISVSALNLTAQTFNESDIQSVYLNEESVTTAQLAALYDYNREYAALNGILSVIKKVEAGVYYFQTAISQEVSVEGIAAVTGDMVDNSDPTRPVINHDAQKLDVAQYATDKTVSDGRLTAAESNITANTTAIQNIQADNISSVTVNGVEQPIIDGVLEIDVEGYTGDQIDVLLAGKVNASIGTVTKTTSDSLVDDVLTLTKTTVNLADSSISTQATTYDLGEILGIDDLKAADHTLVYFVDRTQLTSDLTAPQTLSLAQLYRNNDDGSVYSPDSTGNTNVVFAVSNDNSAPGVSKGKYVSAIGRVISRTATSVTALFSNNSNVLIYNKFNGYRAGQVVYDPDSGALYHTLLQIPAPATTAAIIPIENTTYYTPVKDETPMPSGTIWANLTADIQGGESEPITVIRDALLELGAAYDSYVAFTTVNIPASISSQEDYDESVVYWALDGYNFQDFDSLAEYLEKFEGIERYTPTSNGTISFTYDGTDINIVERFTISSFTVDLNNSFIPTVPAATDGNFPQFSGGKLIDSGLGASGFATAAQGALADSAVQAVTIGNGTNQGDISLTVDGVPQTAIVGGLGSAAYTASTAYATAAQGALADTSLQPGNVVDNLGSTSTNVPLSANQGRILEQRINAVTGARSIGGFNTFADAYTNTSQYATDLQPIAVGDLIYIAADENHTNQPAEYSVSVIAGDGTITYAFKRIVPDSLRDFMLNPVINGEIADGAITGDKIQDASITGVDIAPTTITEALLSNDLQNKINSGAGGGYNAVQTSGTGNVVTNISGSGNTLTQTKGNALTSITTTGTGQVITGISSAGVATKGNYQSASTTREGIVRTQYPLVNSADESYVPTSHAVYSAIEALRTTAIADAVTLSGVQTISGQKTFSQDVKLASAAAKISKPITAGYLYATEYQVANFMVFKPTTAISNNVPIFDASRNIVDSGLAISDITPPVAITNNEIDLIIDAAFA